MASSLLISSDAVGNYLTTLFDLLLVIFLTHLILADWLFWLCDCSVLLRRGSPSIIDCLATSHKVTRPKPSARALETSSRFCRFVCASTIQNGSFQRVLRYVKLCVCVGKESEAEAEKRKKKKKKKSGSTAWGKQPKILWQSLFFKTQHNLINETIVKRKRKHGRQRMERLPW